MPDNTTLVRTTKEAREKATDLAKLLGWSVSQFIHKAVLALESHPDFKPYFKTYKTIKKEKTK